MTPDQMFTLALLGLLVTPFVTIIMPIITRVMDRKDRKEAADAAKRAEKKADAAYKKSEELVELGNHHNIKLTNVLEEVKVLQKAVIKVQDDAPIADKEKVNEQPHT